MTRTCATPTCSGPSAGAATIGRMRGFTLLEILLVVTIIGILAGVVVLSATDVGQQRAIRAEAERLALAVELARGEAQMRNEVWGLAIAPYAYRFLRYDEPAETWHDIERREFAGNTATDGVEFSVATAFADGEPGAGDNDWAIPGSEPGTAEDPEALPSVVIYPSGEITPFEVVVAKGDAPAWIARSDGIQRTKAALESEIVTEDDVLQAVLGREGDVL